MEVLLDALYASAPAEWLRWSRWGYASVNAAHILAFSLLVGSISTLDLKLLGAWRRVELATLVPVLVPVAATGLALAMTTGALLFITRADEYAALPLFLAKMALVAAGAVHAISVHLGPGLVALSAAKRRAVGAASMAVWISVLVLGRMLAFVE